MQQYSRPRGRRAFLLLTLACASPDSGEGPALGGAPDVTSREAPSIRGTLTRKTGDRILIEEEPLDSSGSAKASVRLTTSTRVIRGSGEVAAPADLRPGQKVSAWFAGPVQQSYPVQATAIALRIERDDSGADLLGVEGVVRYHELEGGFYAIRANDGETYNPINLPDSFRQDGLPIRARLRVREDMMGIHQAGPLVEIVEIRKR